MSHVTVLPTITLLPAIDLKKPSKVVQILTSPKTTIALGGILAAIINPAAAAAFILPKTITGAAKLAFVAGAITAVPALATQFNPFTAGKKAAPFIADPSLLLPKDKPLKEKVLEVAKAGGIGVGVAAALAGAAALIAKAVKKVRPGLPGIPGLPGLPGAPGVTLPTAPSLQPLGAVQPPKKEVPKPLPKEKPITIRNTFNPEVNIRFSKSRRFINQQVLLN